MKKMFINPEIEIAEVSQLDAIMVSGNPLVVLKNRINYTLTDEERELDAEYGYWDGK